MQRGYCANDEVAAASAPGGRAEEVHDENVGGAVHRRRAFDMAAIPSTRWQGCG